MKGTRILSLDWVFMHDLKKYPDLDKYYPERYLEPSKSSYKKRSTMSPNINSFFVFMMQTTSMLGLMTTLE
ncbi:hypothetical protein BGZ60DRAFT_538753 [Tricladium varicosporioides]|nr:hypothetical protein BGZ60DRAFT_538753 [Hymenoscyphus varicosporioides]